MRKISALFILSIFLFTPKAFAIPPVKIDNMLESDYLLDEMLPNPVVYLYGTDSNGFPILLMNFSATIPFYGIRKNPRALIRKRMSWLKFAKLRLKIEPTENPKCCKNFYYKILKIQCYAFSQKIDYVDRNTFTGEFKPTYKSAEMGSIKDEAFLQANYYSKIPIISYSGVGSDTLKIMLRRGKKYPIPSGRVDVAMVVLAVPFYTVPLKYDTLDKYDYVQDFLDSKEYECDKNIKIRSIYFRKAYSDNYMRTEYEVDRYNNPRGMILDSQVILGSGFDEELDDNQFMNDTVLCPKKCKESAPTPTTTTTTTTTTTPTPTKTSPCKETKK